MLKRKRKKKRMEMYLVPFEMYFITISGDDPVVKIVAQISGAQKDGLRHHITRARSLSLLPSYSIAHFLASSKKNMSACGHFLSAIKWDTHTQISLNSKNKKRLEETDGIQT